MRPAGRPSARERAAHRRYYRRALMGRTYDRELSDIFAVQSEVAQQVASALRASFSPDTSASLERRPTANLQAYDLYLRGNAYYNPTADERSTRLSIQLYDEAVKQDPTFTLAWARLAEADARLWWYHWDRSEARLTRAKSAIDRAVQQQPDLPDVHRALGFYYYWGRMDYDRALQEFEIARKGWPGDSWAVAGIGWIKRRQGRFEESLTDQLVGMELDPLSPNLSFNVGETHALLRRPAEADRYYNRALLLDPASGRAFAYKARLHLRLTGDVASARTVIQRAESAGFAKSFGGVPRSAPRAGCAGLPAGLEPAGARPWRCFQRAVLVRPEGAARGGDPRAPA